MISVIAPLVTVAVPDALAPSPVIVTYTIELAGSYPEPPFVTLITSIEPVPAGDDNHFVFVVPLVLVSKPYP